MADVPGTRSGLSKRQQIEQTRAALLSGRSSCDSEWRELSDYIAPKRTRFQVTDKNRGGKRTQLIIDSSPRGAARTLQSGLHAGITSPARPWFRLTTPDPDLADQGAIKEWLHVVTQRMHTVLLRSNIYNSLPVLYGDLGVFGTAAMAMLEDDQDMLRTYAYPLGSFVFGLDARSVATTWCYDYRRTVRQLIEEFGSNPEAPGVIDWSHFSNKVKSLYDQGQMETGVDVCWYVAPNDAYAPHRLESKYMKWSSCHFERGTPDADFAGRSGFLRESGFRTFPFLIPRWEVTGDDSYGTGSPGMDAIGDVKQLQYMQKKKAKAIDKALDPPLKGPSALRNQKVSLLAGDITYTDGRDGQQGLSPIHEVRLEGIRELVADMAEVRLRIRDAFYADLFLMIAQSENVQPVTAEEIRARQEEKLIALGPVLERLNDELLDPLIDRAFDIMTSAGAIPEPPEELEGVDLKVEYISIMAAAQKLVGVVGQDRFLQGLLNLAPLFPEVKHKVDVFQVVDAYADKLGVDPKIVRPDEEAQASLEAEQQALANAQQAEQLKTLGQGAQSLANAPLNRDSALDAVMRGQGASPAQAPSGTGAV